MSSPPCGRAASGSPERLAASRSTWCNFKRKRSPCTVPGPLSDPDIDVGSGHQCKRYLSEMMSTGLSLHMNLGDIDNDPVGSDDELLLAASPPSSSGGGAATSGGGGGTAAVPGPVLPPGVTGVLPTWPAAAGLGSASASTDAAGGPSSGMGRRTRPVGLCMDLLPQRSMGGVGSPTSSLLSRMLSPGSGAARGGCGMNTPDFVPTSPGADMRFPLDLRKTALLRNMFMRTDESAAMAATAGGTDMAFDVAPEVAGASALAVGTSHPAHADDDDMDGVDGVHSWAAVSTDHPPLPAARRHAARRLPSPPLPPRATASCSESVNTLNSMDTGSTSGSSNLDEVEQGRRMSLQSSSGYGGDGGDGTGLGSPEGLFSSLRARRSAGGSSGGGVNTPRSMAPLPPRVPPQGTPPRGAAQRPEDALPLVQQPPQPCSHQSPFAAAAGTPGLPPLPRGPATAHSHAHTHAHMPPHALPQQQPLVAPALAMPAGAPMAGNRHPSGLAHVPAAVGLMPPPAPPPFDVQRLAAVRAHAARLIGGTGEQQQHQQQQQQQECQQQYAFSARVPSKLGNAGFAPAPVPATRRASFSAQLEPAGPEYLGAPRRYSEEGSGQSLRRSAQP